MLLGRIHPPKFFQNCFGPYMLCEDLPSTTIGSMYVSYTFLHKCVCIFTYIYICLHTPRGLMYFLNDGLRARGENHGAQCRESTEA